MGRLRDNIGGYTIDRIPCGVAPTFENHVTHSGGIDRSRNEKITGITRPVLDREGAIGDKEAVQIYGASGPSEIENRVSSN